MKTEVLEKVGFAERDGFSYVGFHPVLERTLVVYATSYTGFGGLQRSSAEGNVTYAYVHDGALAQVLQIYPPSTAFNVGQLYVVGIQYRIIRGGLVFDTSTLPLGANIQSASIALHSISAYKYIDRSFNIVVISGADLADPLVVADYGDLLDDIVSRGSLAASSFTDDDYTDIPLNATGISEIVAGGTTFLGLRSSRDIDNDPPLVRPTREYLTFGMYQPSYPPPRLTITYS